MHKQSRLNSLIICLSGYITVFFIVLLLYTWNRQFQHIVLVTFVLDIAATLLIFLFSVIFNNSSFYDPYWSIAPLPIFIVWYFNSAPVVNKERQWIILALIILWSFRLTFNWIRRWKGMNDEDWRYAQFRSYPTALYWLISLAGFHVFPTLVVFAGCLSVYPAICHMTEPLQIIDAIALILTLSGIVIEMVADRQLTNFLRNRKDKAFLSSGLWKYSRHPNYFGEILFWIGLFTFSLQINTFYWYTLSGPIAMILMFSLISVPMMDKRMLERKSGYQEYKQKTSALVPWFTR
ncbi:MAG: DUF1295 domain-containing protein [Bacteroidales bacterium]|nr:DUF1295 domain-containing protein [Bacteroidales bacterium]